ncbi:RidA family protein [Cryptosporangium phraense]|uniref:RidA family protein n=2 Tax=Cryptosporangium phraense TaxID=2593070 RepID=A0A545AH21_9ACTN|nr:RidA family protein [Cryptosporangium phraense]
MAAVDGRTRAGRRAAESDPVRRVNPFELPKPRGYSHATIATGQLVFLAAQTGADRDARIVDGGLVAQFDRAVQNLLVALAAAGGTPEHLTRIEIQVTSIDDYKGASRAIGNIWRSLLGGAAPALTVAEVRRLWDPEAVLQVSGHAVIP